MHTEHESIDAPRESDMDPLIYKPGTGDLASKRKRGKGTVVVPEAEKVLSDETEALQPTRRSSRLRRGPQRYIPTSYSQLTNPVIKDQFIQRCLRDVYSRIGGNQFMMHEMPDIPQWLYQQANDAELKKNWVEIKIDIPVQDVPKDANIIGSHIVYNVNMTGTQLTIRTH